MDDGVLHILAEQVGAALRQRSALLTTAESCTGGLIGHWVTSVPGSSKYYLGGAIVYANQMKKALLGVPAETLAAHGAVSRETALAMADGARRLVGPDREERVVGLSVTGIAGPGGGTVEKPVGTVWIGISSPRGRQAWQYHFNGARREIKAQSAETALRLLLEWLHGGL
ncbi:MAG TPA: CinA family protein [Anaerolineaceae bacterium]|nr:CinA family protein [Anaerolineaceae bacterium]